MVEMRLFARGPQSASASGMDSWHLDFSAVSKKHSSRFRRDIVSRWSSSGIHTTYVGRHNFIQVYITHTHTLFPHWNWQTFALIRGIPVDLILQHFTNGYLFGWFELSGIEE